MEIKYEYIFLTRIVGELQYKCWYDIKIELISEHTFNTIQILQRQAV